MLFYQTIYSYIFYSSFVLHKYHFQYFHVDLRILLGISYMLFCVEALLEFHATKMF